MISKTLTLNLFKLMFMNLKSYGWKLFPCFQISGWLQPTNSTSHRWSSFLHWNFRLNSFEPWSWNFYNVIIFYVKCRGTFLPIAHRCWIQFILCRTCLLGERSEVGKFKRISIDKRVITVIAHQGQPGPPSTPISLHFQVPSF